jgi:hypothetical protein
MNTTSIITNEATGDITRFTILHPDYFNYRRLILAILVTALLAWALRKIFWEEDSN